MKSSSFQVSDSLFLVRQPVPAGAAPAGADPATNHVFCVDVSGSMSYDLPKIRDQIKKKVPKLLSEQDTLSIIWFSGRGECGVLLEAEPVATLKDLKAVEHAVDRWLRPVGLTGFKEPLELAADLASRLSKGRPGSVVSLVFLSDGCDNSWPRADVLKAVEKAGAVVQAGAVVEYGYYADRALLSTMAEKLGASHIFAEDFDRYAPQFEQAMQRRTSSAPRVEVGIDGDPLCGVAFSLGEKEVLTYAVEAGSVKVPEGSPPVWFLSPSPSGTRGKGLAAIGKAASKKALSGEDAEAASASYAAISLFSSRAQPQVVLPLVKALGEAGLADAFGGLFGKQRYSAFSESSRKMALDATLRLPEGYDPDRVPRDDAFTILDLLAELAGDDGNRLLLDSDLFSYSRIGKARVDSSSVLTDEEREQIRVLTEEMGKEKSSVRIKEIQVRISAITDKPAPLEFEAKDTGGKGYEVSNLTYNEDRPNVSVLVRKEGTVDVSARRPAALAGAVPDRVPTHVFRNYSIVKDGIPNVERLPVLLSKRTSANLTQSVRSGRLRSEVLEDVNGTSVVNLKLLPVVNRKMVKSVSAKDLFEKQYDLVRARAAQKVFKAVLEEVRPGSRGPGGLSSYGDEGAAWLREQGITEGGFNPKTVADVARDFYMARELKVSIKGLSSLPSVKDVRERMASGKLTPSAALMARYVEDVEKFKAGKAYASGGDAALAGWLDAQSTAAIADARRLILELAVIKFSIVVGGVWPFETTDQTSATFALGGSDLLCSLDAKEVRQEV